VTILCLYFTAITHKKSHFPIIKHSEPLRLTFQFLPHDALVYSAVLRCHVVRPFLRLSVCLSVCDVGGSGSHRLEILETNCNVNQPNTFALRSPKAIHLIPGKHAEIWGRLEVGWEKVACWMDHKSGNIFETRKDKGKVTMDSLYEVKTLFRTVPSATPYGLPFPKIRGSQPHPKTAITIIPGMAKATDCKFGRYIHSVHRNTRPLKIP